MRYNIVDNYKEAVREFHGKTATNIAKMVADCRQKKADHEKLMQKARTCWMMA